MERKIHPLGRLRQSSTGSRKSWHACFIAITLAGATLVPSFGNTARADAVKVGYITTLSGPQASLGDLMLKGSQLYIKEHAKDLPPDASIELLLHDDGGPVPDMAKRLAQELITRDHVQILAGVVWTPNVMAMAPLLTEAKMPFVAMNAAASQVPRASRYIVRVSSSLWQVSYPLGKWAAENDHDNVYTVVSDFIAGHDIEEGFLKAYTENGGHVVGRVGVPLANPDFVPFLQRVKDAKPQTVFMFVVAGPQATGIIKASDSVGLRQSGVTIVTTSDVVPDDELPNMGDAPLGIVNTGWYSPALKNPNNEAFLAAWRKAYGDALTPSNQAVSGWDGMAAIFDLVIKTHGKFTGDEAMALLSHWQNPNSPRGPIAIDPQTRDIVQNIYLRRVEKLDGHLENVDFETFPAVKDPWKELNPEK